jgi:hypothetical protein
MTWTAELTERVATATGIEMNTRVLGPVDADPWLRLGGIAPHERAERTNAARLGNAVAPTVALGTPLDELSRIVGGAG